MTGSSNMCAKNELGRDVHLLTGNEAFDLIWMQLAAFD